MNFDKEGKCSGCGYYLNDHRFQNNNDKEMTLNMICPKAGFVSEWD